MGTDAAVSGREPLFSRAYSADGRRSTNGMARIRQELLRALREEGLLDSTGSYQRTDSGHGPMVYYCLEVVSSRKIYRAEAPACLGEVTMHVYEV